MGDASHRSRGESTEAADASDEIDWELEMADSKVVELAPEAIQESSEYRKAHGVRLSAFGGPAGEALNAALRERFARRRAERKRQEQTHSSELRSGPPGPAGVAGAGPG